MKVYKAMMNLAFHRQFDTASLENIEEYADLTLSMTQILLQKLVEAIIWSILVLHRRRYMSQSQALVT